MTDGIKDKVVVITGATGRIGLGLARAFHAAGALVALGDLRQDAVERAAADLGSERTFAGTIDVRDEASTRDFRNLTRCRGTSPLSDRSSLPETAGSARPAP